MQAPTSRSCLVTRRSRLDINLQQAGAKLWSSHHWPTAMQAPPHGVALDREGRQGALGQGPGLHLLHSHSRATCRPCNPPSTTASAAWRCSRLKVIVIKQVMLPAPLSAGSALAALGSARGAEAVVEAWVHSLIVVKVPATPTHCEGCATQVQGLCSHTMKSLEAWEGAPRAGHTQPYGLLR